MLVSWHRNAHFYHTSLGQSPWLLDILWHLPFTAKMRRHGDHAIEMMHKRVEAVELPGYRDLASYLVSPCFFPDYYRV